MPASFSHACGLAAVARVDVDGHDPRSRGPPSFSCRAASARQFPCGTETHPGRPQIEKNDSGRRQSASVLSAAGCRPLKLSAGTRPGVVRPH